MALESNDTKSNDVRHKPVAEYHSAMLAALLGLTMAGLEPENQIDPLKIPPYPDLATAPVVSGDWLSTPVKVLAKLYRGPGPSEVTLDNGLVRRTIRLAPDAATVALVNRVSGESYLRAVKPESTVTLNGETFNVGGLVGQPDLAYLKKEWLDQMKPDPGAFHLGSFVLGQVEKPFDWKQTRHSAGGTWPPRGVSLKLRFGHKRFPGLTLEVQYEMYDGLPVIGKRLVVRNYTDQPVRVDAFACELLGVVETESAVEAVGSWREANLQGFSDYSFGGNDHTSHWREDPAYTTQVNYALKTPCLYVSSPEIGPAQTLRPNAVFEGHRSFLLLHDSDERERRFLAVRRFYRGLAPWATENPLMLHLTSTNPETVRTAMDQAAECGFETVIFSFGSGLDMEDTSKENIAKFKSFADYGHSKGLQVGGYSLLAGRSVGVETDVINPKTGKPGGAIFGNSPCLGSAWGEQYFANLKAFLSQTGFDLLEHDGNYPGDVCASASHPGHQGLDDSQWTQWRTITNFYGWCRGQGIYLNVPDQYFLAGSNKTGMGYRETNWSLPREQQHIHARQNLYDGTWNKLPTMGWMFVPLVEYQGGGAAATIEPLHANLRDYERHLVNNLAFGAQACYRGPRLYDHPDTKAVVVKWVTWFKKHRGILESDVVHIRRADGQDYDAVLHVNAALAERAMLCAWNPTPAAIKREIVLPLGTAGLSGKAKVSVGGGAPVEITIDAHGKARLPVSIPADGFVWAVVSP